MTLPGGEAGWKAAVRAAKLRPVRIDPTPGPGKITTTASLAHYLSRQAAGGPFVFSGDRVAKSLGLPRATAFHHIGQLDRRGVIHWHRDRWSRADRIAREAVFVGTVVGQLDPLRRTRRKP